MTPMCRMVGYLGDSIGLARLVEEPPHSLERQSYAARELDGAVVNADGWGVAFYLQGDPAPCVYRSTLPIWADANRAQLCRAVRSWCLLAAVRSATDPLSISQANTQPFGAGPLAFLHNGYFGGFSPALARRLRRDLSDDAYVQIRGTTDSEHLFAALLDEYTRAAAAPAAERLWQAVERTLARIRALTAELGSPALLSLVVSDGTSLVGVRTAVGARPPSLYVLHRDGGERSTVVASEPLDDDGGWQRLAEHHALRVHLGEEPEVVAL